MEDLSFSTNDLKVQLSELVDDEEKEKLIFKHIETAEEQGDKIEEFPANLDWLNTSERLTSEHLLGKIVVLDFFTYCCINCLHLLPHLKQLEENYSVADGLVVIGVHSAKFENEKDSWKILLAVKKYNISHPVVNDKECYIWNKLGISCWPTVVILGPKRQPLFVLMGEDQKDDLLLFVKTTLKFYEKSLSSHQLLIAPCDKIVRASLLNFPGKISRWKNLFAVSDSGNHRIIIFSGSTNYIKFIVGGPNSGFKDGSLKTAQFNSPQGLEFYDANKIYVADTENHAIRLIDLETSEVTTVVGTGRQGTDYRGGQIGTLQEISSPWDVCIVPSSDVELPAPERNPFGVPPARSAVRPGSTSGAPPPPPPPFSLGDLPPPPPPPRPAPPALPARIDRKEPSSKVLLIAAAGTHQIWAYFIDSGVWWKGKKYKKDVCVAVAGSGKEENRNNHYPMMAGFAQPSGLCYSKELKSVYIADSESSSVRKLSLKDGSVSHVVGGGKCPSDLFAFGDVDGRAYEAKLQHPVGVVWSSKRSSVFVCDTYNHKMKRINVRTGHCKSLHQRNDLFCEPNDGCLDESENFIYVCDTNNNCIKRVNIQDGSITEVEIKEKAQTLFGISDDVWEEEVRLSKEGGELTLKIEFFPEEMHGKWRLNTDNSKCSSADSGGSMTNNNVEFVFKADPSPVDDVIQIFFHLVLCGSSTCSFKKLDLKFNVRRVEGAVKSCVCILKKTLE